LRNPSNDHAGLDSTGQRPSRGATPAIRTCVLTRTEASQDQLIRLALSPDGEVLPDIRAKAPGRGAWIGVDHIALTEATARGKLRGALARAFKSNALAIPDDLADRIADQLRQAVLDRLGLEARAGTVLTGSEKIAAEARAGKLNLLIHAADAAPDGAAKLAQAWRVGMDEEGGSRRGLTLPLERTILSMALGRENVVHIGVTDPGAARRILDATERWLRFIGPAPNAQPCETASQGASAVGG
jgi:hypothetical protein